MKYRLLGLILSITYLLSSSALAQDGTSVNIVTKEACVSSLGYENVDQLKKVLLINAKREAVATLFGESIRAITEVSNSILTSEQIELSTVGIVRLDGNANYYNDDEDFASVCVEINGYVTDTDRQQFVPQVVSNPDVCVTDPDITNKERETIAKRKAVIGAVLNYDSELEAIKEEDLYYLLKNKNFTGSEYETRSGAYCANVTGELLPIEISTLKNFDSIELPTLTPTPIPVQAPIATVTPTASKNGTESGRSMQAGTGNISIYENWEPQNIIEILEPLNKDTVWETGNLYVLKSDLLIPEKVKLTILPGVVIKIEGLGPGVNNYDGSSNSLGQRNILVSGTIIAEGTEDSPIIFTSLQDDKVGGDTNNDANASQPLPGSWGRIQMNVGSNDSVLKHVHIRYAGAQAVGRSNSVSTFGAITFDGSNARVENSVIESNFSTGIHVKPESRPTILTTKFEKNNDWAIYAHPEWLPILEGNQLRNNGGNGLGLHAGTINDYSEWYLTEHPIGILGDIDLVKDATLKISPGVVIKVEGRGPGLNNYDANRESLEQWNIFVSGKLLAEGTEDLPIIFTSLQDDKVAEDTNNDANASQPLPGSWGRIQMNVGSNNSVLKHVHIRYAGAQAVGRSNGVSTFGAITFDGSNARVENSVIESNFSTGIHVKPGSRPTILTTKFEKNNDWAIYAHPEWLPILEGNQLRNNGGNGLGLHAGTINDYSEWYLTEHPIGILGDIDLVQGAILEIEPGVVIKVEGRGPGLNNYDANRESLEQWNIFVSGKLLAEGTEDSPIIFTSLQDDKVAEDTNNDANASQPLPGSWGRIQMNVGSNDSVLKHVHIRYAGAQAIGRSNSVSTFGAITFDGSNARVENSVIESNFSTGIHVKPESRPTILTTKFEKNNDWAIYAHPEWLPILEGNQLRNNGGNGLGLHAGTINDYSEWYLTEHPIGILGDIDLVQGAILEIKPGVVIKVEGRGPGLNNYDANRESLKQWNIFVSGKLLAEGTEDSPIIFTSLQDDKVGGDTNNDTNLSSAVAGNWGRIEMRIGSDDSVLGHVEIRYAGTQAVGRSNGVQEFGVLTLDSVSPAISNIAFVQSFSSDLTCINDALPSLTINEKIETNCTTK